ncbi:MAG: hypothetical protein QXL18_04680 [Candidatus Woesearchaeota archaeon]
MTIKKILYILILFSITPIALAEEDMSIGLIDDSTITAIFIGVGVIIGLIIILKMKKNNKNDYSNMEDYIMNYDSKYEKITDDALNTESTMRDVIHDGDNFNELLNGKGEHTISASIPIIKDDGNIEIKKVSGIDNIERTFEDVVTETLSGQKNILNHIYNTLRNLQVQENKIIEIYSSINNTYIGREKTPEYRTYTEHMHNQLIEIEDNTKKITFYLDLLKKYLSQSEKALEAHKKHIESLINNFDNIILNEVSKLEDSFDKLSDDIRTLKGTELYDNYSNTETLFKNIRNKILYEFRPYNHEMLKPIIDKSNMLFGEIERIYKQLRKACAEINFEYSIKNNERGLLGDIFYKFDMNIVGIDQFVNPDNFDHNFQVLEQLKELIETLEKYEKDYNNITSKVDDIIKDTLNKEKTLINKLIFEFEKIRQKEILHKKDNKKQIFDEIKYIEEVLDNPRISDITSKENEFSNRKNIIKSKKYDPETRAIIDLLYNEILDKLEAEKSSKIPAGTAYKDIRRTIKNITNLKVYNN